MKYIIVLADGMADYPVPSLNNRTPLEYARTPHIDRLAARAEIGMVKTVPDGMPPGSDVANLSVMGYDPRQYYTGRSPLEALSIGVDLQPEDVAFRCNLVTLSDDGDYQSQTMIDYSSDEIPTEESHLLIKAISESLNTDHIKFYPGISYRHLMVWRGGPENTVLTPPHDIPDQVIAPHLPRGEGADTLIDLAVKSQQILRDHPVNKERIARGQRPANSLWFWGQGKKPALPEFRQLYGLDGAVISAVDLVKGLGICAGLQVVDVPGATGNIHTNFRGKAAAALKALEEGCDFVYIHVEAPDEAGHRGELETKIKAIEAIDGQVIGELLGGLESYDDFRLMLLPDHPTPLAVRTHTAEPVPYLIYQKGKVLGPGTPYTERAAASGLLIDPGFTLMQRFTGLAP